MDKIILIDGHSILNRAFYGVPDLTNSEGLHTNAVYGFLNIVLKILDEEKAKYMVVAFDVKEPTFRHKMYTEYKGTRKPMPDELREQVPVIKEVLNAMNIKIIEKGGYEADDILGTIARRSEESGLLVSIISGDKDLLQLATEKIKIRIPKTKMSGTQVEDYFAKDVLEKYQVTPTEFIDLKALMGDTADNIPGVPGIGEKTATKIISEYKSIEEAYKNIEAITPTKAKNSLRDNYNLAELSKKLATIETNCNIEFDISTAEIIEMYNENVYKIFKRLEFKNLINKFNAQSGVNNESIANVDEGNFKLVNNIDTAREIFDKLNMTKDSKVGFSIIQQDSKILGLSLTFSEEDIYFIKSDDEITEEFLKEQINNCIIKDMQLSTGNLKEQLPHIVASEESKIFDISIAAYLLNPLKDTYNYDDIARDYLNITVASREDLLGKMSLIEGFKKDEKASLVYACYQSYISFKACDELKEELNKAHMLELFKNIEMPLVYTLSDMEQRGIKIDTEALKIYGDKLMTRIIQLEEEIHKLAGEEFNIQSPKQLGEILFNKLGLPSAKKTKTGYSTSAEVLDKLRTEHLIVDMVLEYRQLTKLKSTYADGLASYVNKKDSRIYGKLNQTITATGRISSTEPNLQNIPIRMELGREIRKVFIPEDDYVFVDADYSQIELRVLAHISGDELLISAYMEEQDIHKITASQVFHTPLEEVTSEQRSNAKAVNFGIVYGISSFGLGQDLNITKKEAEQYIKHYFETYKQVKVFLEEAVASAKDKGYVTTMFNRRRPVPEIKSSNFMQRSFGERIAMNSPIQGTAADIIKIAMIKVNNKLKSNNMKSRLILQIHDELLIETHKDELETVKKIVSEEMKAAANLRVPLEVDLNTGLSWYESK